MDTALRIFCLLVCCIKQFAIRYINSGKKQIVALYKMQIALRTLGVKNRGTAYTVAMPESAFAIEVM
jgi:hypothetical protein